MVIDMEEDEDVEPIDILTDHYGSFYRRGSAKVYLDAKQCQELEARLGVSLKCGALGDGHRRPLPPLVKVDSSCWNTRHSALEAVQQRKNVSAGLSIDLLSRVNIGFYNF